MRNSENPIPYVLAFIGLVACVTFGKTDPHRAATKAAKPARVVRDGWHAKLTERMPVWKEMEAAGAPPLTAQLPTGA